MTRQRVHGFAAFLLAVLVSGAAGAAPVSVRMRLSDLDGPLLVNGVPTPVPGDSRRRSSRSRAPSPRAGSRCPSR